MDAAGVWRSPAFVIDEDVGERRFIDITWNPVSRRFFVGYNVIGSGFKECSIRQAAVTASGFVAFVRTVNSSCDGGNGGHRSSSATDDNVTRNPQGNYLWYVQNGGHNKVYLMDRAGEFVRPLNLGEGSLDLALPVALANVQEAAGPSYGIYRVWGAARPPYAFLTLAAGGATVSSQATFAGESLAAEALANKFVTATGVGCQYGAPHSLCAGWFISVRDL